MLYRHLCTYIFKGIYSFTTEDDKLDAEIRIQFKIPSFS